MGKARAYFGKHKKTKRAQTMVIENQKRRELAESRKEVISTCGGIVQEILESVYNVAECESRHCAEFKAQSVDPATPERNSDNEYNFSWGSVDEYHRIVDHKVEVEVEEYKAQLEGYRIVDIDHLLQSSMKLQSEHNKKCTGGQLIFHSEKRYGLASTIKYMCNICDQYLTFSTEKNDNKHSVVNAAAVWGTLATGSTYAHLSEFLSVMDVPAISGNTFFNIQRELGFIWKESLWDIMEEAGKEERELAIQRGDVSEDQIPFITVLLVGGWSKRSYGHSYNANSGVAVIIGRCTKKLLYLGVRNKFCSICARSENKNEKAPEHICFKNWNGSASAMEPDIIVEGFNTSIEMHNLRYKRFIADGDSTVFSKIKQNVIYGSQVVKLECTNHCVKNYSKRLYEIKKDTKGVALNVRKMLSKNLIEELTKTVQKAIYANAHGDLNNLKEDIRNSIPHVFGNNTSCKEYLCDSVGDTSNDKTNDLKQSGAHHHIYGALNLLLTKANLLIDNETNNLAEMYMNILARFNMGKRLNLTQRDSFQMRSYLTGLRYNEGPSWHTRSWKKYFTKSPGKNLKKFIKSQEGKYGKRKLERGGKPRVVKKLKFVEEKDYGTNIAEIEMPEKDLQEEVDTLIGRLKISSAEEQKFIESTTKGQFLNEKYVTEKMNRLTASNFGAVIKRLPHTSCDSLVKRLLNTTSIFSSATEYGLKNEQVAIGKFMELTGKNVEPSGLFVDRKYGFLGASPDGIISSEEIVEVKCLHKVAVLGIPLKEAVKNKEVACLKIQDDVVSLNEKHNYYYQIQGQLAISGARICHFIVYTGDNNELFIQSIEKDLKAWNEVWVPKLSLFYANCLAPEIILNRRLRNLKCRDPKYILDAQENVRKIREERAKKKEEKKRKILKNNRYRIKKKA